MTTYTIYVGVSGETASVPGDGEALTVEVEADAASEAGPVLTPIFVVPTAS